MSKITRLKVLLHRQAIGEITLLDGERSIFSFSPNYLEQAEKAVLSLGFRDIHGDLITEHRPYRTRVMPFFSNLLPEGSLRKYLAARAGVAPTREFFLLEALGRDLPGAVTLKSTSGQRNNVENQEHLDSSTQISDEHFLRFSLAGVQLKFSAVMEAQGGLTIPTEGVGGSWIVKLPSSQFNLVPENEFSMMTLAGMTGITIPECKLVELTNIHDIPKGIDRIGTKAYAVKRFDRDDEGEAIHMEDFAQIFRIFPEEKYRGASARNIANVVANECGLDDVIEFVRRLTFSVLTGNADMHLKNWSLIYEDRLHPRLAPAYDFVSTIPYIPDEKGALKIGKSSKFADFSAQELKYFAAKAKLPEKLIITTAQETISLFHQQWGKEISHLPCSQGVRNSIEKHFRSLDLRGL